MNKSPILKKTISLTPYEKASERILMEKMGLASGEFRKINSIYGVDASHLLELMQLNKYRFIFPGRTVSEYEPCNP